MTTVTYVQTRQVQTADPNDSLDPTDFNGIVQTIGTGMRNIARTSCEILGELQTLLKSLRSVLNEEQQDQIIETFLEYHKLLTASQRFLTRGLILAARARTAAELMQSINRQAIQDICSTVENLLDKFLRMDRIVEEKLKDQRALKRWRNIFGLFTLIGSCAFIVGGIYGCFISRLGFTKELKVFLVATGAITVAAGAPTAFAHNAQHVDELNRMKISLKEIRAVLINLSENYPQIEEMAQVLSDDDGTRHRFLQLLRETEIEVKKGFELLRHF